MSPLSTPFWPCRRTLISDDPVAYDPERAMAEVAAVTHFMPRSWRGRAHTAEVRGELGSMFVLKVREGSQSDVRVKPASGKRTVGRGLLRLV